MESVWWVFKQLFDKGLVYRGFKARRWPSGWAGWACCMGAALSVAASATSVGSVSLGRLVVVPSGCLLHPLLILHAHLICCCTDDISPIF